LTSALLVSSPALAGVTAVVEADTSVREENATKSFGDDGELRVDGKPEKRRDTFFRVRVSGIGAGTVAAAVLRLRVTSVKSEDVDSSSRLHRTTCAWAEQTLTWAGRPPLDPAPLDRAGRVRKEDTVEFRVTDAVRGDGLYCFALVRGGAAANEVKYASREAKSGGPQVLVTLTQAGGPTTTTSTTRVPTTSSTTTTTVAPPRCGNGRRDRLVEDCDGGDDGLCPGTCLPDCRCALDRPRAVVDADVSVREDDPDGRFGAAPELWVDASSGKQTLLRVRVMGVDEPIGVARLLLRATDASSAGADTGGRLHVVESCDWDELGVTWRTRPGFAAGVLDEADEVQPGDTVEFDVTSRITASGLYCFALDTLSTNGVIYHAREAGAVGPRLELVRAGDMVPVCGDGVVNLPGEACDGSDDERCPGRCLSHCACAVCGNGVAERPIERCDGSDAAACPAGCRPDCTCEPSDAGDDTFSCLASGADVVLSGTHTSDYYTRSLAPGTVIDATAATFVHCSQPDPAAPCAPNVYPINLGPTGGAGACWAGGVVAGANRLDATWSEMHSPNNSGFSFENGDFTVTGVRIHNVGDGIRPRGGAGGFLIRDVWLSWVRDDCVENDHMNSGTVEDSLFDGCFVGFSARNSNTAVMGPEEVWTIRSTLVRLQPMPGPPEGGALGHKGFFKWVEWGNPDGRSPRLALYDNVFMAEEQGQVDGERMGIPPGKLVGCANNVMVWLGPGDYPAPLPDCFTVTRDRRVWVSAVADWLRRHPGVGG
jgi:hypothetical protein